MSIYQLPSRIDRYEIKTLIGAGGMGALYLARDTNPNTNRLVALKLLNATLDSHELRERFAREARALAALDHPNVVAIHDSGEFQGSPYIVMEYVRGETIAERIKRTAPMSLALKLKLMTELCSGLAHAHEAGIIHRDIKPANLMVDQHGRLKILDFGIARVAEGTRLGTQVTQLNMQIGTPGYMSPEQIEGGEIDRRSDIFAAGVVCYELLAYREAFPGATTRQIENKVLEARPTPLCSLVPDLDPAIQDIVSKALARDPGDRFQDAAAFEESLERQRWKLGPVETPVHAARATPASARDPGPRARDSRAEAAYRRSLAVYEQGAVEAARRFAIEALAEDPDHLEARAFIERLGASLWPLPPPSSAVRTTAGPTELVTAQATVSPIDPAAATVLSTGSIPVMTVPAIGVARVRARYGKALQVAAMVSAVVLVVALAGLLVVSFRPRGPLLTIVRPTGGSVWAAGIDCGSRASDCTANVTEGEWVQLRAEADADHVFAGFGGDCTKSGRVRMARASSCTVTFNPLPKEPDKVTWTLTLVRPEKGTIVGPGGIRCGSMDSVCKGDFPEGRTVTLSAYATDPDFAFRGFTGDCSPEGETVMTGARRCAATFALEQRAATPLSSPRTTASSSRAATRAGGRRSSVEVDSFPPPPSGGGNTVDPLARTPEAEARPPVPPEPAATNPRATPAPATRPPEKAGPEGNARVTPDVPPAQTTVPVPAGNTTPLRRTRFVEPVYPVEAQKAGVLGTVVILLTVGADGRVKDAQVVGSVPLLDTAALDAVKQWEYAPRLENGVAVPMTVTVRVEFKGGH